MSLMIMENEKSKYKISQEILGKKECPICKRFLYKSGFSNHYKYCKERNGDWETQKTYYKTISEDKIYTCNFCNRSFDHNFRARNGHQMKCKLNPKREETIEKIRNTCSGKKTPTEVKKKISESMKEYRKIADDKDNNIIGKTKIKEENSEDFIDLIFKEDI